MFDFSCNNKSSFDAKIKREAFINKVKANNTY